MDVYPSLAIILFEKISLPATGSTHTHSYGTEWKYDGTNHWHECECSDKADTAAHSFQWVIDKAASCHRGMGIHKANKAEINDVLFRIPANHYFST